MTAAFARVAPIDTPPSSPHEGIRSLASPPARRLQCADYFAQLQAQLIAAFEALTPGETFQQTPWKKQPEEQLQGSGIMASLRGEVFEKIGVNFSHVHGQFSPEMIAQIPGAKASGGTFWASGVSVVAHPANPYVPAAHMNVRRIETSIGWFGGGADLTPTFEFTDDTQAFHQGLKDACDAYCPHAYSQYAKWCDEYFFLPHRNETRGVGGIFFDNLDTGDFQRDFGFVKDVAQSFQQVYCHLVATRRHTPFSPQEREQQLIKRGRYVEFNLLYDRGTKFGLMTGGNPEAILMSMPPSVKWP